MATFAKSLPLFFMLLFCTGHASAQLSPLNHTTAPKATAKVGSVDVPVQKVEVDEDVDAITADDEVAEVKQNQVQPSTTFLSPKSAKAVAVGVSAPKIPVAAAAVASSPVDNVGTSLDSMEAAMTDLMLGKGQFGATPMGGSVKTIKNLIENVMKPKIMTAHKGDVKDLARLYGEFAKCRGTMTRSKRGANAQMLKYRGNSKQHKRCRADEAVKFTTQKNCLTAQKNLFLIKKGKCATFNTAATKMGTTKDNRAIVTKAGGESVESYITRISVTICGKHVHGRKGNRRTTGGWGGGLPGGFLDKYFKLKEDCQTAERNWKNKVKECKRKVADYKRRKGQCDQFQTLMDGASCKGAIQSNDACQAYSECYMRAKKAYDGAVKRVKKDVVDRKAEWRGVHRISCLINSFADGKVTNAEVDACKRKTISTKPMEIKILPAPPRARCTISQLYPSTGLYKRVEFGPLPALAKGQESVECSGMQEVSLKPRKGSPSSCKCERVTLNGPYSAKAMVKCTNCIDVRRTSDADSCPSGTKIFAPASKSDWETFFASTGKLAAPHWIVDVTKPTGGGKRSSDPMNSGNRKQRANGWRTSDGAPWWLRSTGYGEPNGNYHPNCYLGIHGGRANSLTFDDNNCGFHSKSYYCQLKRIDLKPARGSPKSCKCQKVDLTGSYKPGRLIKCSECMDVSKSTQRNSCPTGTKIFSPTSQADWRTFIKSATPLNAPHFIIDVTRSSDGCQRGSSGCEKSAMNSGNPKQSTWRTSDRSPWWLRSSSYNQPDGNYKANCFLHLWKTPHNSETNIQFDDANRGGGCYYHSRSYYCQPKQKSAAALRREKQRRAAALRRQKQRDAAAKASPCGKRKRGSLWVWGRYKRVNRHQYRLRTLYRCGASGGRKVRSYWHLYRRNKYSQRRNKKGPSCEFVTYKHGNFKGKRVSFRKGNYDMGAMQRKGQKNDDLSSVELRGKGCKATVYEHSKFNGKSRTFATGNRNLVRISYVGRDWNDKVSSIRVS